MSFVQTITITTSDESAVAEHVVTWHAQQFGIAPGYRGARLLEDRNCPGRFTIEASFTSEEEAALNNERPETREWAETLQALASDEVRFFDKRVVLDTLPRV